MISAEPTADLHDRLYAARLARARRRAWRTSTLGRAWHTRAGRRLCSILTLGQHVWHGWLSQGWTLGSALPMARCERCGFEW